MLSLSALIEKAATAQSYMRERSGMKYRAIDVYRFIRGDDPLAANMEQFTCGHHWAVNEETDRCYCLNCGLDGDA